MAISDPIADMLTRIRNAVKAKFGSVDIPASKLKIELAKILSDRNTSIEDLTEKIEDLGIHPPPGELKGVELIFSPGQRKPVVHIHSV